MSWFNHAKTMSKKRKLLLLRTYLPDWIITIVLFGLFYLLDRVNGFRRQFDINDTSIMHTFAVHERVPPWALAMICAVAPAVIILVTSLLWQRSLWDFHSGWLGLLLALALTSTSTNIIKIVVGRPRPDLLDRCQPLDDVTNAGPPSYGLSNWHICTRTDLLNDGFRSFPSGHSSLSWCGLGFLTLYLAGKMHIWDQKGVTTKSWILLAPLSGAMLVTLSRTMDYRHHATDVIAGSILGALIAWFSYRQYYPPLDHPLSHKPYSPRVPREVEDDPEHDPERNQLTNFQSSSPTHKPGNLIPSANGLNGQSRRENDEGVPIVNGYAV